MNHLLEDDEPSYPVHKALAQRVVEGAVEHACHLKERITVPVSSVRRPHCCVSQHELGYAVLTNSNPANLSDFKQRSSPVPHMCPRC